MQTRLRPLRPGLPGFAVSSLSRYTVAAGKAAILSTIALNSRLVRWLSMSDSCVEGNRS